MKPLWILLAAFPLALQAAAPRFSQNEALGSLRLRLPANLESAPLPTIETRRAIRTWPDGRSETLDLQAPDQVWYRSQHLADWLDKTGATLTLAAPTAIPPAAWPQPYATRSEYADLLQRLGRPVTSADNPLRLQTLKTILDTDAADLSRLFSLSHEAFYAGSQSERLANYALAWGLVAYLRAAETTRDPAHKAYAKTLETYLTTFLQTQNPRAALDAAFPPQRMPALQRNFTAYWKKRK